MGCDEVGCRCAGPLSLSLLPSHHFPLALSPTQARLVRLVLRCAARLSSVCGSSPPLPTCPPGIQHVHALAVLATFAGEPACHVGGRLTAAYNCKAGGMGASRLRKRRYTHLLPPLCPPHMTSLDATAGPQGHRLCRQPLCNSVYHPLRHGRRLYPQKHSGLPCWRDHDE